MTDTDALMAEESLRLNNILDALREEHGEPVAEDENMVVFADTDAIELTEIAANTDGVSRKEVSEWMHDMARKIHDRDHTGSDAWSVADPVVVLKWNDGMNTYLHAV